MKNAKDEKEEGEEVVCERERGRERQTNEHDAICLLDFSEVLNRCLQPTNRSVLHKLNE